MIVGDVVLTPFTFTDLSRKKNRPAVIVADVGMEDWVACEITSSSEERPRAIEISSADFQRGGLKHKSWVRPDRIATLNESVFTEVAGHLAKSKQAEIAAAIRALF